MAELDGRVAAFVALSLAERRLDQLFGAARAQGRGLGLALFNVARQAMPDSFWLSPRWRPRARAFYTRRAMVIDATMRGLGPEAILYVAGPVS